MEGLNLERKIKCDTCPRCKDIYPPDKVDSFGNHFFICGMSGNMVYTKPRKEKRLSGPGWVHYEVSTCGLYDTLDEALESMTEIERQRYFERVNQDKQRDAIPRQGGKT